MLDNTEFSPEHEVLTVHVWRNSEAKQDNAGILDRKFHKIKQRSHKFKVFIEYLTHEIIKKGKIKNIKIE